MNKYKKILMQLFIFVNITLISMFAYLKYPSFFSLFENKLNDVMFLARGDKTADDRIVIVDIDEKSLQQLGQWPWSRNKVATILEHLTQYGAGIIGLDIVFAEKDNSSPKLVLQKLGLKNIAAEDYDKILAETIAASPTVTGYVFALKNDTLEKRETLPKTTAIIIEKNKPEKSSLIKPYRAIVNIPVIKNAAYSSGYFNTIPDEDGVVRSIPMIMEYRGLLYPSLSLELTRLALGERKVVINYYKKGVESIRIGKITIPTDRFGRMIINYRGRQHKYKYISACDIYANKIDPKEIAGKIVLVGTTAAGLLDLRSTPFDSVYPGVEVHATAIDNILNQEFLARPSWIIGFDIVDIFLSLSIAFGLLLIPNAMLSFTFLTLFITGLLFMHYYTMTEKGLLINTLFPLAGISFLFVIGEAVNYFLESRQKERIKQKFATKVSPAVVEELIANADSDTFDVKEKEITILFSDIRDFTSISEKMDSAKSLINLLNEYMTPMVDIITKYKGTVDKFIGDAIMAYWNAPTDVQDHPDKALQSAIEQILRLETLNIKLSKEKKPNINIGIGINTGVSVVGEMGSIGRSDYTCIGDSVNLASRAEGLCKVYASKIILSEYTKKMLKKDNYFLRELDTVRVKGKNKPVTIYECMGYKEKHWVNFNENDTRIYTEALKLYKNSHFKEAKKLFTRLNNANVQKLYTIYIQRCEYYIHNRPKDFDGVFTFTNK
ncbi:CHASE2 domain-containing protein [Sulfurimonas sp. ST-27]|uniref:CHASE2 domain-containing protein n=1 Tax=Sulfurimonas sp. ST-27 TaxID=3400152 RepID=UPI003AB6F9EA